MLTLHHLLPLYRLTVPGWYEIRQDEAFTAKSIQTGSIQESRLNQYTHPSEVLLIVNFFNLISLYFRHNTYARFIHVPAVSGPLAWTFVALYWNGAIAVNAHSLPARIFANVAIWGILVFGGFFIVVYKVRHIFHNRAFH